MCTINKNVYTKNSGNLFNDPRVKGGTVILIMEGTVGIISKNMIGRSVDLWKNESHLKHIIRFCVYHSIQLFFWGGANEMSQMWLYIYIYRERERFGLMANQPF